MDYIGIDIGGSTTKIVGFSSVMQEQFAKIAEMAKKIWDSTPIQTFVKAAKTTLGTLWDFTTTMWGDIKNNALMTWQNIQGDLEITGGNLAELWTNVWKDFDNAADNDGSGICFEGLSPPIPADCLLAEYAGSL